MITPVRGSKIYLIYHPFSLRIKIIQKSINFNPYQIILRIKKLTHIPTENPITNIHRNQQNICDIHIQLQELNKGMLIENTLKGKAEQSTEDEHIVASNKSKSNNEYANSENSKIPYSRSGEHMRQQSGIEKYSRHSKVT